ncbi:MAG TPA: porin [Ideonella sp.]|nr:porin [Ideonella sp.]
MHHPRHALVMALAACAGTAASAQSASSSVTVYGLMDACLARADLGNSTNKAVNSGCLYGSRLGFRGTEDLGDGHRAYFVLESGFTIDSGALAQGGRIFGRKALLGLAGPWGGVDVGRDYAPAFYLIQPVDPMALGIGTATSTLWSGSPSSTAARVDNAINYLTPRWGGVSARLQFAPGEQPAPAAARGRDVLGLNVLYQAGNTVAGLSHARVANAADSAEDRATTVALRQNFGRFSLAAIVQSGSWQGSRDVGTPASASSIFSRSYRSYLVGGSLRVGDVGSINTSLKRYDDRTGGNFDITQWSIAYVHSLSKRTDLYAGYSQLDNRNGSSYAVSDATGAYTTVDAGARTSLLATGIKHSF